MSDTSITKFEFNNLPVRLQLDDKGEPWLCARDVCDILGLVNPTVACQPLAEDEKGLRVIETPGGRQKVNFVSEPGFYALIGNSNKPEAKALSRHWRHNVLPSIRKTGAYIEPGAVIVAGPGAGLSSPAASKKMAELIDVIKADVEADVRRQIEDGALADIKALEKTIVEERDARDDDRRVYAEDIIKIGKGAFAVAEQIRNGTRGTDRLPPEWNSGHTIAANLPIDDVMLGLGFKTKRDADTFLIEVVQWVDVERVDAGRDSGGRQMEFREIPRPSQAIVAKGWMAANLNGGPAEITPKGRGAIEAFLAYHRHKYDLRGPVEVNKIRGQIVGKSHAGDLPELRAAYVGNRSPVGTGFTGILVKQIAGARA